MKIKCLIKRIKRKIRGEDEIPLHRYKVILETEELKLLKCEECGYVEVEIKEDIKNE